MKSKAKSDVSDLEDRLVELGIGVCVPVCALTLGEGLAMLLHQSFFAKSDNGPQFLFFGVPAICALLVTLSFTYVFAALKSKLLTAVVGLTLALYIAFTYRGAFTWPGTFHLSFKSSTALFLIVGLSAVCGFFVHALTKTLLSAATTRIVALSIIVIALIWSWLNSYGMSTSYSEYPFSRHFAITVIVVAASVLSVAYLHSERT